MKDIDQKELPDASGGYSPGDDGCMPRFPGAIDFPKYPITPSPEPVVGLDDPAPYSSVK